MIMSQGWKCDTTHGQPVSEHGCLPLFLCMAMQMHGMDVARQVS